jgi:hypothetical protein
VVSVSIGTPSSAVTISPFFDSFSNLPVTPVGAISSRCRSKSLRWSGNATAVLAGFAGTTALVLAALAAACAAFSAFTCSRCSWIISVLVLGCALLRDARLLVSGFAMVDLRFFRTE